MTMSGRAILAALLAGALALGGCGGGNGSMQTQDQQAGQGVAVGEPNGSQPGPQAAASFIKLAQEADCTDIRNRLFLIDGKQVFWDRAGKCGDAAYAQTLFGATPEQVLCSVSDSIAGPRSFCADDQSRALFDTIQKNLDKADLGLAGHKVERVGFLPKSGTALPFESLVRDSMSGVTAPQNVVLKDAAAFQKLWLQHAGNRSAPGAMPKVDFEHQMVLAVFSGRQANGCHAISVVGVVSDGGKLLVEYDDREVASVAACAAVVSTPMHMVVVERSDAAVGFVPAAGAQLAFKTLDQTTRSAIGNARNVVVRDVESWSTLWAQHAGAEAPLPAVDFSKQMVIGVFLGTQDNGCYSTTIKHVADFGNKLTVLHTDAVPGPAVLCTLALTRPAHLVVVDRSDRVVEFATEVAPVR
ncbi:MAG: hypothetical protein ACJ8LG_03525 [Massilia sp.]